MASHQLHLRPEHMRALARAVEQETEKRLIDHCFEALPTACAELGEAEVRRLVRQGQRKAAEFGVDTYPDVLTMVELVVEFGEYFEETEPWAGPIWEANNAPQRKLSILAAAATEEKIRHILEEPNA